jgi:hypothetical protein
MHFRMLQALCLGLMLAQPITRQVLCCAADILNDVDIALKVAKNILQLFGQDELVVAVKQFQEGVTNVSERASALCHLPHCRNVWNPEPQVLLQQAENLINEMEGLGAM